MSLAGGGRGGCNELDEGCGPELRFHTIGNPMIYPQHVFKKFQRLFEGWGAMGEEGRIRNAFAILQTFESLASDIHTMQTHEGEERFPDDICGRIRDGGTRYQDLAREFRQVFSHDEELLLRTKNAFETDLLLARKFLGRTWRKICEIHKFSPFTRVPGQRDVACTIFSGDFSEAEVPRNLDVNAAADEFQSVLDDVVPRMTALRGRFEELIRAEGSFRAQCSEDSFGALIRSEDSSTELDLPVLEQEALLVATELRKLERFSDSIDALRLNIVVTAPNGEIICERDATLYASSGSKLTVGALTNSIRDDIEASLNNFVRIRDADPVKLGIEHVQSAIRGASLPLDSTYSGSSDVGRAGLIKLGYDFYKLGRKGYYGLYDNVVFSEAVRSDIGPGKLSLVCQMEQLRSGAFTVVASVVFFSEKDEQFYQLPLKCDNISRSSEQTDTLFHTIPAPSSLIGGEGGSIWGRGGGVDSTKTNNTVAPTALSSDVGFRSGFFSRGVPKGSRTFGGGFFGKSSMTAPTRFQFSDEGSCAAAYSAIEAFHGKDATCSDGSNGNHISTMPHYLLEQRGPRRELEQRWDYPLIAAITRGRVTEAVIHHKMETSAELPKIGEFLKSFTTDTIDLGRIKIVPYGADDLFDDETAVLDVLRQQDRDDMEWEVRGSFIFSSWNAGTHSAE